MNAQTRNIVQKPLIFLVILAAVGITMGFLLESALLGFACGLVAAAFAVGPAKLIRRSDGSWTLVKRK